MNLMNIYYSPSRKESLFAKPRGDWQPATYPLKKYISIIYSNVIKDSSNYLKKNSASYVKIQVKPTINY